METVKILQVVGYKNSGKTTLIREFIRQCTMHNQSVCVIKHHGHTDTLALPSNEVDSMHFFHDGARAAIAVSQNTLQLHMKSFDWTEEKIMAFAKLCSAQVVLIEGFKQWKNEKVVLIRNEQDREDLKSLSSVRYIHQKGDDKQPLFDWFSQWLKEESS